MNLFEKEYYENDEFWKPGVFGKADQERVKITASLVPDDVNTLLDAGCGNGLFCNYLDSLNKNIDITGLDRSNAALNYVKTKKIVGDICEIPFEDNSYDCVCCLQVIEHLPGDVYFKALSELARISKKYVLISVPFEEKIEKNTIQCPECRSIFNRDLHLRSFTLDRMGKLLVEQGFAYSICKTVGSTKKLIGFSTILKLLHKKTENKFIPICPICGYQNKDFNFDNLVEANTKIKVKKKGLINLIKNLILYLWPKVKTKDYWIVALYTKK